MSKGKSDPKVADREIEVLKLRRGGLTFDMIADRVGYASASGAYKAWKNAMRRVVYDDVDAIRKTELDRLDIAQAAIWGDLTDIQNIDANTRARLILALIKVMERRSRLLGLDVPVKAQLEVNIYDRNSIDSEVARLVSLLNSKPQSALDAPISETGTVTD
jgi:hypothetical protein